VSEPTDTPIVELVGITKSFPGVLANDRIDLTRAREILFRNDAGQVAGVAADDARRGKLRAQMLVQFLVQFDDEQLLGGDAVVEHRAREHTRARAQLDHTAGSGGQLRGHQSSQLRTGGRQRGNAQRILQPLAKE